MRHLATAPSRGGASPGDLAVLFREPIAHPYASALQVAALLPAEGDYQGYGRQVAEGLEAGLGAGPVAGDCPLRLRLWNSGQDSPAHAIAAFDSAAHSAAVVVGELLSVPTFALAAAASRGGVTLISPTAADESVGMMGRRVYQIGPSAYERGQVLARAMLAGGKGRVGILVSSAVASGAFAKGFAAAADSAGAATVWNETYAPGTANFRDVVRTLVARRVELLFWDGDAREAENLLRQLAREHVSVRICGGAALAPDQYHAETQALLEGVQYVADDWTLAGADASRDSGATAPLFVRGQLAGRCVREAVAAGALCAEEIATRLDARLARDPYLNARRFLDVRPLGAALPVWVVRRGRAVAVQ